MIEFLIGLDKSLFWFINTTTANPVFDKVMPFITERNNWFLLYIFLFLFLFIKQGKTGRITAILAILAVALADQTTSGLLKPLAERLRPCHELEGVRLLVGCGSKYGFPSSHAANFFAAAAIFNIYFPKFKWLYFSIAFLVAYSRAYVGVHYPLDLIVGALVGAIGAYILSKLYSLLEIYSKPIFINLSKNKNINNSK
jgi:undecaprenyl-diphosphatase